ncbi:ABC transporter permease [Clostridium sp. CCUG 7971]|uniref:ABC transporter permease n=1 Tax=Clostridium sp. CCUG 7971 TaxID=2811414 RepID=UPI001ABB4FF7|nr:ABC transporter permease [Clostridium sp. CCUG 7971]MBO3444855.1 ABC transporter permease [Clostridium sp. CCUG 7971]
MITLLVAKNEFLRSLKNKKKLLLMIFLPLISIVLAIGVNSLMKPSINIGIIENSKKSNYFEESIKDIDRIKLSTANKKTINTDMILAKYLGIVEFKENNNFEVYCLDENMKVNIEKAVADIIKNGDTNKIKSLLNILEEGSLSQSQRGSGFILLTSMITCITTATILIKDKEDGILNRYSTSPNKLSSYILGNYTYNLLNTIIQVIISTLLLYLLKINIGIGIGEFIIIGIVISIVTSSIATLITILSKSELQASLLASSIALIMSLFGGAFLPIDKMPEALKFISNLSITKWIIQLTSSIEKGISYEGNLMIISYITLLSLGILLVAIKIGKRKYI